MKKIKGFFVDIGQGISSIFKGPSKPENLFSLDGRTNLGKAIPFGIQHVLAMFASNVAPLTIVFAAIGLTKDNGLNGFAVQALLSALFIAGIGTMIQLLIGSRLPIVIGTSFIFVPIFISFSAGRTPIDTYYVILGSILVAGICVTILGLLYKYWAKIIKPIVPAIVVLGIGLSLLSVGANSFFGGNSIITSIVTNGHTGVGPVGGPYVPYYLYIIVAFVTIISAILWNLLIKGVWKNIYILVGIAVGFITCCCMSIAYPAMVDFSFISEITANNLVGSSGIVDYPRFVDLSKLKFELVPCLLTTICALVASVECIGDTSALANSGLNRNPTTRELSGSLASDGFSTFLASLFGSLPLTTFSQNVGIVGQTKVVNRFTIFIGACFLIFASLFPPIANFIYCIPEVVIGATMVVLFGTIAVIGMQMIAKVGWNEKNTMITAIAVCLGFGLTIGNVPLFGDVVNNFPGAAAPTYTIFKALNLGWMSDLFSNVVLNVFIIAFILSWIIPENIGEPKKEKGVENNDKNVNIDNEMNTN